jgi:hypothetical protein
MKPDTKSRLAELERRALARHLQSEPSTEEREFIDDMRQRIESGSSGFPPEKWDAMLEATARELWMEHLMGLSDRWGAVDLAAEKQSQ